MATSTQLKTRGYLLLASFFAILIAIFMPLFPGIHGEKVNGLDYLDNFFNELSKGSAYYIDQQLKKVEKVAGQEFATTMKMKTPAEAAVTAKLFTANGITADGATIAAKYGMDERLALNGWYLALTAMEKDLTKAAKFDQAKLVKNCMTKAIEPAYNYYKVEAKSVKAEMMLLIAALAFYVIYTIWYGFGLLFLFEGMGIKLEH